MLGTPDYMPIEQARGESPDARRELTGNLAAWIGTSALSEVLRDELMRQWAEAERLLHGELPKEFTYDLAKAALAAPR